MTLDLLILALIAGFILYRLYVTLGQRTGFDRKNEEKTNVISFEQERQKYRFKEATKHPVEEFSPSIRQGVQEITKLDPEFSIKDFTEGATNAFEMIIENYAKGDIKKLSKLLSPDLLNEFKRAIEERLTQGYMLENTLIRIEKVEVQEAHVSNNVAYLKVKFISEQVPLMKDKNGTIVEGNPNQIDQVIDYWTFERNLKSSDPNWTLIETDA